jgi:hypothetical protein
MDVKWYLILFAAIIWFIISITALIYATDWLYNERFIPLLAPKTTCNRSYLIQSWIYDVYGTNNCPQPTNSVEVVNNILYAKNLVQSGQCCSFGDLLTRINFPEVYIGQRLRRFTDVELNSKPYVINSTKTSYNFVCGICTYGQTYQLIKIQDNKYFFDFNTNYIIYFNEVGQILSIVNNGVLVVQRVNNELVVYDNTDTFAVVMSLIDQEGGFQPLAIESY